MEETPIQIIKDRQIVKVIQNVWLSITLIGLLPLDLVVSLTISLIPHEFQWKEVIGFSFIADVRLSSRQGCWSSLFSRSHPTNPHSWHCHLTQLIFSVWERVEFFFIALSIFNVPLLFHYSVLWKKETWIRFFSYTSKGKHHLT